jgi:hypothetical protein
MIRLDLTVSPEAHDKLQALATQSGCSVTDVFRRAIALLDVANAARQQNKALVILNQDRSIDSEIVGM